MAPRFSVLLLLAAGLTAALALSASGPPELETGGWSVTRGDCRGGPEPDAVGRLPVHVACYRANFRLGTLPQEALAIYLASVRDDDMTSLNGHPVGATGRESGALINAGGYRRAYPVHAGFFREGVNEIAIEVRCSGMKCGPDEPAVLLPVNEAVQRKWIDTVTGLMIATSLALAAVFFLIVGWGGARAKHHLWFVAFIAAGAVELFTHEPAWAPEVLFNPLYRIESFSGMALFPLYAGFLVTVRDWPMLRALRGAALFLLLAAFAIALFPPALMPPFILGYKIANGAIMAGLLVRLFTDTGIQSHRNRWKLAVASLILSFSAGADLLEDWGVMHSRIVWLDNYMPVAILAVALVVSRVLAERFKWLRLTAYRDPLTGLNSRRFMDEFIPPELARAARLRLPVAVLFIDIDHFKRFNDRHGHAVGDAVLRELAQRLNSLRREGDLLCRWGGEEFALFMIGQGLGSALDLAERLRAGIAGKPFELGPKLAPEPVTISIGAAALPPGADDLAGLLEQADSALYVAKRMGRDQVASLPARGAQAAPAPGPDPRDGDGAARNG